MGFWGDLWRTAKQGGEAALHKLDGKMDAVRAQLADLDTPQDSDLQRLLREAGIDQPTPEQMASLRALARRRPAAPEPDLPDDPG